LLATNNLRGIVVDGSVVKDTLIGAEKVLTLLTKARGAGNEEDSETSAWIGALPVSRMREGVSVSDLMVMLEVIGPKMVSKVSDEETLKLPVIAARTFCTPIIGASIDLHVISD
jgi:hypothetical protein